MRCFASSYPTLSQEEAKEWGTGLLSEVESGGLGLKPRVNPLHLH
jgi:hypothetical protein